MKNYVLKGELLNKLCTSVLWNNIQCVKIYLLVISDKNKMQTCVNQKEYQLANVPKKIRRWTAFLHDCMQSFEQWHLENISFLVS